MLPYLAKRKGITVFTCGLTNAMTASEYGIMTLCSGGRVRESTYSCDGPFAERMMADIHVDYLFFSSRGLCEDGLVSHQSDLKCRLIQLMLRQCRSSYLLCDNSKAGIISTFRICSADELTGVISDQPFPFEVPNLILP